LGREKAILLGKAKKGLLKEAEPEPQELDQCLHSSWFGRDDCLGRTNCKKSHKVEEG
jgi:hypothetical protein